MRPVDDLVPYQRNARTHSDRQIAQLVRSLLEFGWTNPVLTRANVISAGHGRVLAARRIWDGGKEIPNVPHGMVPTIAVDHMSDEQMRAYIIADNQLALNAGWDEDLLAAELAELNIKDFDLALTGLDERHLKRLLGEPTFGFGGGEAGAAFEIIVTCENEAKQAELLERLTGEGLKCKALMGG